MKIERQIAGVALLAMLWVAPLLADGIRQWERDLGVATPSGDQGLPRPVVVTDGSGGAFVLWQDRIRATVHLKRLAADGSEIWPAARLVALTDTQKLFPVGVASGQGEVIVAWAESRSGGGCFVEGQFDCDIYAQKFNADGQRLWSSIGRPVVRAEANQGALGMALAPDGAGGVFVTWADARPACCKIYAQHLDQTGLRLWGQNGIRISPEPFIVFGPIDAPLAVSDGEGGVFIAWIENQVDPVNDRAPIQVQRLDADGNALWTEGGIKVGEPTHGYFSMASDGAGGALIGYTMDGVNGFFDAAVQKVTPNSTTPWGAAGVRAAVADYYHSAPEVISDGRGGAIIAWIDNTFARFHENDADIRAQRVLADGRVAWGSGGRIINDLPGDQDNPRIVSDGDGGAFVFWRDCRDYFDRDECFFLANLYGQHI